VITAITLAPAPLHQVSWIDYQGCLTRVACEVFDVEIYLAVFAGGYHRAALGRSWRSPDNG
jgi:hypothetical protein